ncbi:pilus assembly PilX family protein [Thauera sinica]|uniref:PilX N-terminal domain-containing pilus assembly protein n=1 Tax=Thauera sinica TaxID=2665146 RepID=A0ABW1AVF6_9RHOO|nr:PilX N-terminal domain-containing pilus assembly protein [Thauera sp. K11]
MALITGLIFLVVLTLIVVTSMRTTVLEEKMAGSTRDADLAFQAAEAALRSGELIVNGASLPTFGNSAPYLAAGSRTDSYWQDSSHWTSAANASVALAGVHSQPQFIVEELPATTSMGGSLKFGALTESGMYRVTARGLGASPNTAVILQSTYQR